MAPSPATPVQPDALLDGAPDGAGVIDLWPGGTGPGMMHPVNQVIVERSTDPALHDRAVHGIARPRMVVFRPVRANGAAVMIMPGGGYARAVIEREGYEMARWLVLRGLTCFVLFYRLPAEGWATGSDTPLIDAQRAMRLIRHHARDYGIDPARVAAMGFSAGGHVCADLSARFAASVYAPGDAADGLCARPFCAAPMYPVVSMSLPHAHAGSRERLLGAHPTPAQEAAYSPQLHIPENPPPHFLCHAEDDPVVPVANTLLLRGAIKARGGRVETHLFEVGGHGFGLRLAQGRPVAIWPDLWLAWARSIGLIV